MSISCFVLYPYSEAGNWRLRPNGGLSHVMSFSFIYQIYISCSITLNWTKRSSFDRAEASGLLVLLWLTTGSANQSLAWIPPSLQLCGLCGQLSSKPDPTEEKMSGWIWTSLLIPGMSKVLSQYANEPLTASLPLMPSPPPSQLECDKHVFTAMCGLWLGFFFSYFDEGVQQYNNSFICQQNL